MLYLWGYIIKRGMDFSRTRFLDILKEKKLEFPEKIQEPKLNTLLESDPALTDFLISHFKELIYRESK